MSPKEIAANVSPWFPTIITGGILTLFSFFLTRSAAASEEMKKEMETKATKEFVMQQIEATKKEIDAKRDADFREIKTNIQYIKESVDELKRK